MSLLTVPSCNSTIWHRGKNLFLNPNCLLYSWAVHARNRVKSMRSRLNNKQIIQPFRIYSFGGFENCTKRHVVVYQACWKHLFLTCPHKKIHCVIYYFQGSLNFHYSALIDVSAKRTYHRAVIKCFWENYWINTNTMLKYPDTSRSEKYLLIIPRLWCSIYLGSNI